MKKRSEAKPRMVQQELFPDYGGDYGPKQATRSAYPMEEDLPPTDVGYGPPLRTRPLRKRSEASGTALKTLYSPLLEILQVPFAKGPISDATGGPLSAAEAERVVAGRTIRCSGYQWQDGVACCKDCFDTVIRNGDDEGHGYRAVLYGGAEYKGGLTCFACKRHIQP